MKKVGIIIGVVAYNWTGTEWLPGTPIAYDDVGDALIRRLEAPHDG